MSLAAAPLHIAILDYGAGNLRSVAKAVEQVAPAGSRISLTTNAAELATASHIILPGVGAFADCMKGLQSLTGMIAALEKRVLVEGTPFLGICVGMQMLLQASHEHGTHQGLGWFEGEVLPLSPADKSLKIPQMGWNDLLLNPALPAPLFAGITTGEHAYFVHSYHCAMQHKQEISATVDFGGCVTAAIWRDNLHAVQFHPEKSQRMGLQLFQNFLTMQHHALSR
jgi:glutamine amidotransferase